MSARVLGLGALCALVSLACSSGGNGGFPPYMPKEAGAPPGVMPPPDVDAGPPSGDIAIVIHAPVAGAMLSTNAATEVSAKVTVANGTDVVDPASVRMILTGTGSDATLSAAPLVGPAGDNEYRGRLSLAGLKSGDYTITVVARSSTNVQGSATVAIKLDAGPAITVLSPIPGRSYKGSLVVQVVADPSPFPPLQDLQASIAGIPVMLEAAGPPNQFRKVFDLTMPLPLEGDQIFVVSAKNSNGTGTRTEIRFIFTVDVVGPTITQTKPEPGEIVGGVTKISAQIADPAGLNLSSLQVIIGDKMAQQFKLALTPDAATGTYSVLFDTKAFTNCFPNGLCIVRPSISFRAADLLGNERTVAYDFAIDNFPPVADLDPPNIRVSKLDKGLRCSHDFDPLDLDYYSGDAPDDLCQVPQLFDLRARVQDDGNRGAGEKATPISQVDPEATAAYVLDATVLNGVAQPLVVDSNNDGYCDAINPQLKPTTTPITDPRQVLKIRLRPVKPDGKGDFATPDPNLPPVCLPGGDLDVPLQLCKPGPQPTIAISYAGGLPAIWTAEPVSPAGGSGYCFGSQLDTYANNITAVMQNNLQPGAGWKCIAIATADKVGNTSTSAPLRVYLQDYNYGGSIQFCKAPPANAGPPPNCTGTFDKATGVLSPKACKTRNFKFPAGAPEICFENDCDAPPYPSL